MADKLAKDAEFQRLGMPVYVVHDRTSSRVFVGSFDSADDPQGAEVRERLVVMAYPLAGQIQRPGSAGKNALDTMIVPALALTDLSDIKAKDPEMKSIVLVLGSRNRKKCKEMAELIAPPWEPSRSLERLDIRSVDDFPAAPEVVEDADTFAGNARKKASELARALSVWVVADDSGLTVDALGGAPGVFSARYAGEPTE